VTRTPDLCHIKVPFNRDGWMDIHGPSETFGVVKNSQKLLTNPPHHPTEMLEFPRLASFSPIAWRPPRRQATSYFLLITSRLHRSNRGVSHVGPEYCRVFDTENSGLSLTRKFRCRNEASKGSLIAAIRNLLPRIVPTASR
jgi:hypothetical protein